MISPSQGLELLPLKKVQSVVSKLIDDLKFLPLNNIAGVFPVLVCRAFLYWSKKLSREAFSSSKVFGSFVEIAVLMILTRLSACPFKAGCRGGVNNWQTPIDFNHC